MLEIALQYTLPKLKQATNKVSEDFLCLLIKFRKTGSRYNVEFITLVVN